MGIKDNSEVQGDDSYIEYDMFEHYLNKDYDGVTIEITNQIVKDLIEEHIALRRQLPTETYENYINNQWSAYFDKLEASRSMFVETHRVPLEFLQ